MTVEPAPAPQHCNQVDITIFQINVWLIDFYWPFFLRGAWLAIPSTRHPRSKWNYSTPEVYKSTARVAHQSWTKFEKLRIGGCHPVICLHEQYQIINRLILKPFVNVSVLFEFFSLQKLDKGLHSDRCCGPKFIHCNIFKIQIHF